MKILIVFNHPAPYKVDLFNELHKYMDVDVIFERKRASNRPKSFYSNKNYEFTLIKHRGLKINIGNENCLSSFIKKYIQQNYRHYDAIVMNGYSTLAEMKAIKFMKDMDIPYILLINGGIKAKFEGPLKRKIKTFYISGARYYFSPSQISNEYLIYYGADKKRILNYPYATIHENQIVKHALTNKERNYIRDENFLPREQLFICPNQFIKRKNNLSLIKQFKGQKINLLLVGNGPLKNRYIRYIKRNNYQNVYVWDFLEKEKLMEIMKSCDGLISLSKHDIYGHTIIEGMASGLTVYASKNIVSAHEIIKNGINGYILQKDKELIKCINKSEEISKASIHATIKKYTIENSAKTLANLLTKKCL